MKTRMLVEQEVDVVFVKIEVPVRYDDEDIPYDFPFRTGDLWTITVEMDTRKIVGWPQNTPYDVYMKVVDGGTYSLLDESESVVSEIEGDYVPHGVVPGDYGDYVELKIDSNGVVTNWTRHPDLDSFPGFDE